VQKLVAIAENELVDQFQVGEEALELCKLELVVGLLLRVVFFFVASRCLELKGKVVLVRHFQNVLLDVIEFAHDRLSAVQELDEIFYEALTFQLQVIVDFEHFDRLNKEVLPEENNKF